MPIRHCQKCSLKVLIDESQASVSPFYCQRCTAALKSDHVASPPPAPVAARRASSPNLTPVPATSAVAVAAPSGKTSTVKVFCPYCKASFNGKIPAKPARGSCPLCQKDLILLPTGDIRPAADFDLTKWQAEQGDGNGKESGTMVLVKKYAANPQSTSDAAEAGRKILEDKAEGEAPPAPPEETQVEDEGVELPSWLDETDRKRKAAAAAAAKPLLPPSDTDTAEPVRLEDLDPAPPPPPPPKRAAAPKPPPPPASPPPVPAQPAASSSQSTAAIPAVKKPVAARREKTERRAAPVASSTSEIVAPSGAGKFMLSLLLTALPVAACPILLSMQDKLGDGFVGKLGPRFVKGFKALDLKLFPPAEVVAPKPPPPKPREPEPEAPSKPTAEDARQMEEEINKRWMEYKREERTVRQLSVGATAAQKADIQKAEVELKGKRERIEQLRESYRKAFGRDYDPAKQ